MVIKNLEIYRNLFVLPRCCMNTTAMTDDSDKAAGVWGSFTCDLPFWTFEDMLMQIRETHGDVRHFFFFFRTM